MYCPHCNELIKEVKIIETSENELETVIHKFSTRADEIIGEFYGN